MATTLTATPQPTYSAGVLLEITGAPGKPVTSYASNFSTGVDSWSAATGTLARDLARTPIALKMTGPGAGVGNEAARTVTSLTIGAEYRVTVSLATYYSKVRVGVTGIGYTQWASGGVPYATTRPVKAISYFKHVYTFVATATSHQIVVNTAAPTGSLKVPVAFFLNVRVDPAGSWLGTQIFRTDANGVGAQVRMDGADVPNGGSTLSVYDYEAGLTGAIEYQVRDGLGALASANVAAGALSGTTPSAWLTVPTTADPADTALTNTTYTYRTNLVTNPSFEVDTAGWVASTNCTIARSNTVGGASGSSWALRLSSTAAGLMSARTLEGTSGFPVVAGATYRIRFASRAGTVGRNVAVGVFGWYDATGALVSGGPGLGLAAFDITAGWTNSIQDGAFIAPSGAAYVALWAVVNATGGAGELHYFDAFLFEQTTGTPGAYFDGSTAAAGALTYGWSGTVHASSSVETTTTSTGIAHPSGSPESLSVEMVTGYEETSESGGSLHWIVGRSDPIANPGPLRSRQGSLDLWCADYATAKAVKDLLAAGEVVMLRQPTFPGLDLYLSARSASVRAEEPTSGTRRWTVTVDYNEVAAT